MNVLRASRAAALLGFLAAAWPGRVGAELPVQQEKTHLGVAECASPLCHGAVHTGATEPGVRLDEYRTWLRRDSHAQAYEVLLDARSKHIARNLGIAAAEKDDLCLDCHATNVPAARRGERFHLSDGVTCEACHGSAEGWIDSHARGSTHERNLAAGLYPTEDAAERAELCLSCHLGTKRQFVSHRIMAAGHPRMSFELETFTHLQPHFEVDADYVRRKGAPNALRTWAVGALVDARAYLELFEAKTGAPGWPEFGVFDCYSCHQPIRGPRAVGRLLGERALPRLRESSLLASLDVLRAVAPSQAGAYEAALDDLVARVAAGESGSLESAAKLRSLLSQALPGVGRWNPTSADARRLLLALATRYARDVPPSYSDAEQATMAIQAVSAEIGPAGPGEPVRSSLERLFAATADDASFDAQRFRSEMESLREALDGRG